MFKNTKRLILTLALLLISFTLQATVKNMEYLNSEQHFQEAYQLGLQLLVEEAGDPAFDMAFGVAALRSGE